MLPASQISSFLASRSDARVIELVDQLALVDDVGEPDAGRAVDELESHPALAVQPPDHLQHQQLIEIRIEQRAHDRIDAERVIVDAGGEIGDHGSTLDGRLIAGKGGCAGWRRRSVAWLTKRS